MAPPWKITEDELLQRKFGVITYSEMSKLLPGRTPKALCHRAKMLGLSSIETRNAHLSKWYRAEVNDDFFASYTRLSCYYAGLLAADGCIHAEKGLVSLDLTAADVECLHKFKECTGYAGRICGPYHYPNAKKLFKNAKPRFRMSVRSPKWVLDLARYFNLGVRKSMTLEPPPILDPEHQFCFLAGLIDGDGFVYYHEQDNTEYLHVGAVGTKPMLEWMKAIVDLIPRERNIKNAQVHPLKTIWSYATSGERAENLAQIIKELGLPLMSRKWDKC